MSTTISRALLPVLAALAMPLLAQNFNYPNFSSTSGLTLNGSAAQSGTVLRLTPAVNGQVGSAWFNTQEPVEDGFTTTFQFRLNGAADGIAFVIQNVSLAALGGAGGGLGYQNMPNSLAVEFDIFQNAFDPNGNHVGVQSCGTAPNTADHTVVLCNLGINSALGALNLKDGNAHTAVIQYLPGTLTLSIDGTQELSIAVNLSSKLSLNAGNAWVGFTGATGAGNAAQDILSWSFASLADVMQISYAANLSAGDSVVNLTSAGSVNGFDPAGDICANVYVFAEDQQLIACCTCPLTPDHLKTLSVTKDLISNTLTPGVPIGVTVALVASTGACNASGVTVPSLANGLRAWGTKLHALPGGGFGVTENTFSQVPLSISELSKLTSYCGFIQADGSHFGICGSCVEGAAGAAKN